MRLPKVFQIFGIIFLESKFKEEVCGMLDLKLKEEFRAVVVVESGVVVDRDGFEAMVIAVVVFGYRHEMCESFSC